MSVCSLSIFWRGGGGSSPFHRDPCSITVWERLIVCESGPIWGRVFFGGDSYLGQLLPWLDGQKRKLPAYKFMSHRKGHLLCCHIMYIYICACVKRGRSAFIMYKKIVLCQQSRKLDFGSWKKVRKTSHSSFSRPHINLSFFLQKKVWLLLLSAFLCQTKESVVAL